MVRTVDFRLQDSSAPKISESAPTWYRNFKQNAKLMAVRWITRSLAVPTSLSPTAQI
jgi:hypothetical protein